MAQKFGYTRALGDGSQTEAQTNALKQAGCIYVFVDRAPANVHPAAEWLRCLDSLEAGDFLIVPNLEQLAYTLEQLGSALTQLIERRILLQFNEWRPPIPFTLEAFRDIVMRLAAFERAGRRDLTNAGLSVARSKGRIGGRPHRLGQEQIAELKRLMSEPNADVNEVAKHFGLSRAAIYKNLKR